MSASFASSHCRACCALRIRRPRRSAARCIRCTSEASRAARQRFVVDDQHAQGQRAVHSWFASERHARSARESGRSSRCDVELRIEVVQQAQALAHVGQRHAMAGPRAAPLTVLSMMISARPRRARVRTRTVPPPSAGSMPWRTAFSSSGCSTNGGSARCSAAGSSCQSRLQPLAEAQLLDGQVAPRQFDLAGQRDGATAAAVGQRHAEQFGQVFEHGFGARRVGAHQRDRGIERVEQKVRPDARLQFGQPRARIGRRALALAPLQPQASSNASAAPISGQRHQAHRLQFEQLQPDHRRAGQWRQRGTEDHQHRRRAPRAAAAPAAPRSAHTRASQASVAATRRRSPARALPARAQLVGASHAPPAPLRH